ncbi:MFS transporter [Actinophytocola sp.]|uniref:MFS transporter n=1 Tax=Actinophytocola sp. TaxID=1872138 RepID=UPI002ED8781A
MTSTRLDARVEPAPAEPPGPAHHGHARAGRPRNHWWVLAVVGLAQLMVVLDGTIVNIALPSAQQALHFTDDGRQWIVTAYSLAFGSLLLLGGRLSDLFGRKTTFVIGIIGFASASAVGGAATTFTMLVAARTTQGLFGALLAPAALSLLTTTFPGGKERARAFGIYGAIAGSGAAIGLVLGGLLTEYLDWRWTLYVNDIIAVFALTGALVFLRRSVPAQRPRLDVPGVVLVSGGLFCVVFGFSNASTHSWGSTSTWGFLVAGAVLLLAFFRWQGRASHPLLPLRVLADRNRGAALTTVLIASAGMFGVFLFLTYYLQGTLGYSPVRNGVAFLPMVGILMVTAQLSTNWLVPRIGPKVIVPIGMLLAASGMVWLTRLGLHSTYAAHVLPPLLLIGLGLGLSMPAAMSRATLGVRMADQGVASATTNATQQVGGSISTALLNTLVASAAVTFVRSHPTDPLVQADAALHSYATAYWWSGGFFAVGAIVTMLLFRRKDADPPVVATATQPLPAQPLPGQALPGRPLPPRPLPAHAGNGSAPVPSRNGAVVAASSTLMHGRILDGAGAPVPHAVITLLDPAGRQLARATARADGSYAVDVPTGRGVVLIGSASAHQPQVATLTVGSAPIAYDLVMLAGAGGLTGTVRDADGTPLAGARVVATDRRDETTTTGPNGGYRIDGLLPGRYTVTVNAAGHRPASEVVSVSGASTRHDVELRRAASVRGTVRAQDGRPLKDARVTLLDATGNVVTTQPTAEDGVYAFTDLPGNEYTLIATGYPPVATPITLNGDDHDRFDLVLGREER